MLNLNSTIERSDDVVQIEIDGEFVMMSTIDSHYYELDSVASRIWALIESPKTFGSICQELITQYEVEESECQNDVLIFLNGMAENNIISISA